jgi:hypothetical protein
MRKEDCPDEGLVQSEGRSERSSLPLAVDPRWKGLYRVGGVAALVTVAFIPVQIIVFLAWPPPGFQPTFSTVIGYFTLFHDHRLLGLLDLDLLLIVDQALAIPIALALYMALRRTSESFMLIATALSLVAITSYFTSNTAFPMLSLSHQHLAATTESQRSLVLAAGQAMMASYTGTAFHGSYVLGSIGLLMTAIVMLRSRVFVKATGYVGALGSIVGLGLYVPRIGLFLSILSVPFLAVWNLLIAWTFLHLGWGRRKENA